MNTTNKKGFTLIELLVVVAIIGILSTIGLVALNGARGKARDAKRVSDMRQYALAFQSFGDSAGTYVLTGTGCTTGFPSPDACNDLNTFFQGGSTNAPKDPVSGVAAPTPSTGSACLTAGTWTDAGCKLLAQWSGPGGVSGTVKYAIAYAGTTSQGFALLAYLEAGTAGVGKGVHLLTDAGAWL